MDWRTAFEILAILAVGLLPWSLVIEGVRELWLTWNGKSRNRSVSEDRWR